jgi:hypothetical protein
VEFFGYGAADLRRVREAMPIRDGTDLPEYAAIGDAIVRVREAVTRATGHPPTDVNPTCCDERGGWIFFIGLSGKPPPSLPAPHGKERLPDPGRELYRKTMDALENAVRHRTTEDDSRGYALYSDPTVHALQLSMREFALHHEPIIRKVLASSGDTYERAAAAHLLGYARRSKRQIAALVRASRDPDEGVRNNATRALIALANSDPKVAAQIPADGFIAMLSSGAWSDLNKASGLLDALSRSRPPKLLARLAGARERLEEMARWRTGHARAAQLILGRMEGMGEERLAHLVNAGNTGEVLKALHVRP